MAKNGLLLWVLGGTGLLLMYAAYKNISPLTVLKTLMGAPALAVNKPVAGGYAIIPPLHPDGIANSVMYGDLPNGYLHSPKTFISTSQA